YLTQHGLVVAVERVVVLAVLDHHQVAVVRHPPCPGHAPIGHCAHIRSCRRSDEYPAPARASLPRLTKAADDIATCGPAQATAQLTEGSAGSEVRRHIGQQVRK